MEYDNSVMSDSKHNSELGEGWPPAIVNPDLQTKSLNTYRSFLLSRASVWSSVLSISSFVWVMLFRYFKTPPRVPYHVDWNEFDPLFHGSFYVQLLFLISMLVFGFLGRRNYVGSFGNMSRILCILLVLGVIVGIHTSTGQWPWNWTIGQTH